jgi:hypothetical protein
MFQPGSFARIRQVASFINWKTVEGSPYKNESVRSWPVMVIDFSFCFAPHPP